MSASRAKDLRAEAPGGSPLLDPLLRPASVALFGASPDAARPATRALRNLRRAEPPPRLHAVSPRHDAVEDVPCVPDAASLPEVPDLAVVAVRADVVVDTVSAAADHGTRAFVVFSSGFAELGEEGAARERELGHLARRRGLTLVGPNSLGVIDFSRRYYATFGSAIDSVDPPPGPVAVISQSGALASYVCAMAAARGLGLSHLISTGNEAALDAAAIASAILDEPGVRAVALYLEGVRDGDDLVRFFALARRRGVPVVLMRAGDSSRGQDAARSHTGALAGSARVSDAVLQRHGVVGVSTPEDLVVACQAVVAEAPWGGRRVGVLTGSGGGGALVADACARWGLEVPVLAAPTQGGLRSLLPTWASVANPVDVTATVLIDPDSSLDACLTEMAADDDLDELVVFMGAGGSFGPDLARRIVAVVPSLGTRCSVIWLGVSAEVAEILHGGGVPVFAGIEECIRPTALLARATPLPGTAGLATVPAVAPLMDLARFLGSRRGRVLDEDESKTVLTLAGIGALPARRVMTGDPGQDADRLQIAFPVAVKALSHHLPHKFAAGAVVLGVTDRAGLAEAVARVRAAAASALGGDRVRGVLVEEMAPPGVEVIVGVATDPVFGRVIAVGPGGVLAELVDDVTIVLPPRRPGRGPCAARRHPARPAAGRVPRRPRGPVCPDRPPLPTDRERPAHDSAAGRPRARPQPRPRPSRRRGPHRRRLPGRTRRRPADTPGERPMTWRTGITELLGARYPIMKAGMGVAAGGRLAAAVSEAGGIACIGASRMPRRSWIGRSRWSRRPPRARSAWTSCGRPRRGPDHDPACAL